MKLQIDTDKKVIKIEETINLYALYTMLETLLPTVWKEFSLEVSIIREWVNPIPAPTKDPFPTIPYQPFQPVVPNMPWWEVFPGTVSYLNNENGQTAGVASNVIGKLNQGTYNIEL